MRDFTVLIIYPNLRGMNMLPYSIGLFSNLLKAEDVSVEIFDSTYYKIGDDFDSDKEKEKILAVRPFDMSAKGITLKATDPFEDLSGIIENTGPDLVAMSVTEDLYPLGMRFLRHIDRFGVPVVMGGVYPTFAPEKVLRNPEVDMVCVGEGEGPLIELCRRMKKGAAYNDIAGLWVKEKDGAVRRNGLCKPVDINNGPLPDFSGFEEARLYRPMAGKVYRMLPVETHRGCPFACRYCNSPSQRELYRAEGAGLFFRQKSINKVREELEYYVKQYAVEYIYFWADTFFAYPAREFDAFVEMYKDFKLPFWCQTRPETITEDRLKKLCDVGLHRMSLGIEHGNEEFRKRIINRKVSNRVIEQAFGIISHHKPTTGVSVNNIVGFPTETPELAMDTVELNRKIAGNVDTMNCYAYTPFHGTPLRKMAVDLGYIEEDTFTGCLTGEPVMNMPQFSKEAIKGIMRTFSMYARFPLERRAEIDIARKFTPEGDAMFEKLRKEFIAEFFSGSGGRDDG